MKESHDMRHEPLEPDQGFEPGFGIEMPGDVDGEPEGLESMRNSSRRRQRWLLLTVVIGGIGAVCVLKFLGNGTSEAKADSVVEQLIDHFISDGGSADATKDKADNDSERDLLVLQQSYEHKQIPVESLRCNPFLTTAATDTAADTATPTPASSELLRARRMDELEEAVTELVIDSTLTGSRPMARIGGELVMQGDTLVETPSGIVVTLIHVDRGSVTIMASDPALDLSGQWQRSVGR